jgi:hypothetical protein
MYSTVVTASRQAVRYGSATGEGNNGVPRYQDCDGIRNAANAVGYLGKFDTITLQYDQGVTNANPPAPINQKTYCTGPTDSSLTTKILEGNRTRLVVTVTERFHPIVPKLVPFIERDITASSARTILYSVPIVVEQEQKEWFKNPTTTLITLDDPDASEVNQSVTVSVKVTGGSPAPTGVVDITGADTTCQITLKSDGTGSCDVVFTSASIAPEDKVIVAFYQGDTNSLASSDVETHTVSLYSTKLDVSDLPDPTTKDQPFAVAVTVSNVTAGAPTPTGTVTVDGGGNVKCSFTLSLGMGSCALSYNTLGTKQLIVTYSGDSLHKPADNTNNPTYHQVLLGTPTPTSTPTQTPIPSPTLSPTATVSPTATLSPTPIPSPVPVCNGVKVPLRIQYSGNIMSITISNPYTYTLMMNDLTVTWNHDKGHKTGTDKTLKLQKITVGTTVIWTGNTPTNQYTLTLMTHALVPPGNTTVSFYLSQSYDNLDGSENVLINWLTPGCTGNPINVK